MTEKKEILYIFDGIEEAFEKEYEINKPTWWKDKDTHWKYLMEFCVKYTALEGAVVPSHQTQCLIETKQQYAKFDLKDILNVIKNLGQLANLLYMADRDLFFCTGPLSEKEDRKYKPLQKYYQRALQRVLWRVATFTQDGTSGFVDFLTKLREVMGEYPAEWIGQERPGWGSLALCSKHKAELIAERDRHEKEMKRLRTINFEQDTRRDM